MTRRGCLRCASEIGKVLYRHLGENKLNPLNRVRIGVVAWIVTFVATGFLGIVVFDLSFSTWLWWPYGSLCLVVVGGRPRQVHEPGNRQ